MTPSGQSVGYVLSPQPFIKLVWSLIFILTCCITFLTRLHLTALEWRRTRACAYAEDVQGKMAATLSIHISKWLEKTPYISPNWPCKVIYQQ